MAPPVATAEKKKAMAKAKKKETAKAKPKKKAVASAKPAAPSAGANAMKAERLYRTARDAERMRQFGVAKTFYKMILDKYPDTPAAEKTKERIKKNKRLR